MSFVKFPKLRAFHNVRKSALTLNVNTSIVYEAKIKLHGTNCGVCVKPNGEVLPQRRNDIISTDTDNYGFGEWITETNNYWSSIKKDNEEIVVFGEWFGNGVLKGTSANLVKEKSFAVFAVHIRNKIISNSNEIERILSKGIDRPSNLFVIPEIKDKETGAKKQIEVFFKNVGSCEQASEIINTLVEEVVSCDPFISETFGIDGGGEGLVFHQVGTHELKSYETFSFKAKEKKFRTTKQKNPAQIDPELAKDIDGFIDIVLTESRLQQGVEEIGADEDHDILHLGNFVQWIGKDVKHECKDELKAANLTWKQVSKKTIERAKEWYMDQGKWH